MRADLALIGYGNVARRFEAMLSEQRDTLQSTYNLTCRVIATASRRHGCTAGQRLRRNGSALVLDP